MGGLAEYSVVHATALAHVPEGVDPVSSAILGCAAMTGYGAVRRGADLKYGETVAVVADGGRMVPIGLGAGRQTAEVEINRTVRRSQSILGSYGARTRQDLPAVVDLAARGIINYDDLVTRRFSLDEAAAGYEALRNRAVQGRAVVDMSL